MNKIPALMIGTFMSEKEIIDFVGYEPNIYNAEITKILREVCLVRKYFKASQVKKLKFWRFSIDDTDKLTNSKSYLFECLKSGKKWNPEVYISFLDCTDIIDKVNSQFSYGRMSDEVRNQYIKKLDEELGTKFMRISH